MKILVLGSNGQVGRCLSDQLNCNYYNLFFLGRDELDICNFSYTRKMISNINPDIIINAAAYTAVDKAEVEKIVATRVNHHAVYEIAKICKELDCWLIHLSTDYVFDGLKKTPYVEADATNPQGVYGKTKHEGEIKIRSTNCKHLIIRTSWIFSEYGNNFMKTMLKIGAEKNSLSVVSDEYGSPTYAQDLARAITRIIGYLKSDQIHSSIYHFAGDIKCSWFDFAENIFSEAKKIGYDVPDKIISISADQYPSRVIRPSYSVLDSSKLGNDFGILPSNWRRAIKFVLLALSINRRKH